MSLLGVIEFSSNTDLGEIKGEVKHSGKEHQLGFIEFNYHVQNNAELGSMQRPPIMSEMTPVHILRHVDLASPKLLGAALTGAEFDTVTLYIHKWSENPFDYMVLEMTQCVVAEFAQENMDSDNVQEAVLETIVLKAATMKLKYKATETDGSASDEHSEFGFDFRTHQKM